MQVRPDTERSGSAPAPGGVPPRSGPLAVGVDVVDIARFGRMCAVRGPDLGGRVFTPHETATCRGDTARLAARLAAKEAVSKALGTGIGPVAWLEIEIRTGAGGNPGLLLSGAARTRAREAGLDVWAVSLTHDADRAVAVVVAWQGPMSPSGMEGTS